MVAVVRQDSLGRRIREERGPQEDDEEMNGVALNTNEAAVPVIQYSTRLGTDIDAFVAGWRRYMSAITWSTTPQGGTYWSNVDREIIRLRNHIRRMTDNRPQAEPSEFDDFENGDRVVVGAGVTIPVSEVPPTLEGPAIPTPETVGQLLDQIYTGQAERENQTATHRITPPRVGVFDYAWLDPAWTNPFIQRNVTTPRPGVRLNIEEGASVHAEQVANAVNQAATAPRVQGPRPRRAVPRPR